MVEPNGYGLRNIESSAGAPTDSYSGKGHLHHPPPPCPSTPEKIM